MFLSKLLKRPYTIVFRLTAWYAGVYVVISLAIFILLYFMVRSYIYQRVDNYFQAEVEEYRVIYRSMGMDEVKADITGEETAIGEDKKFFRILSPAGRELAASDLSAWKNLKTEKTILNRVKTPTALFETIVVPGDRYRTRVIYAIIGPGVILQIGQTIKAEEEFMDNFRHIFASVFITALLLSVIVGWFMSRRALSGVEEVTATVRKISDGAIESRVPVKGSGDEIDNLAVTFNAMLDRIQRLISGMKEINDNIAHDLRSPITRMRGLAEVTLAGSHFPAECRAVLAGTVEECDRLLAMINTMLDISEMDAGVAQREIADVDISRMVRDACELFQPVAADKKVTLELEAPPVAPLKGDIKKLQRALSNILDNALRNTPPGGTVSVSLSADSSQVIISVRDTGVGISEHELPRIFNRFY
ncbi:MAG TPA: HAMP domain-containing protein, partial [Proteobacteria bacterium]|nr:HAMP domain-containing protein [Pseudomonadota bacterium]